MRRFTILFFALLAATAVAATWPTRIDLPDGFQPEGIAAGNGQQLYVGSIPTGEVLRVDARKGTTTTAVAAREGHAAIGLKYRNGTLYVAGGPTGKVFVYDAKTGAELAAPQLGTPGATFINDVAVTSKRAYFTDSQQAVLYVLDRKKLTASTLPLTGFELTPNAFNLNGIVAAQGGKVLLAVKSVDGSLWRIDAKTGAATELGGASVPNGDGLLLQGKRTLYVVQNTDNQIAVLRLSKDLRSATLERTITSEDFDVPTTVARLGKRLYLPNARFTTTPQADTDYWITQVRR